MYRRRNFLLYCLQKERHCSQVGFKSIVLVASCEQGAIKYFRSCS
ncbi:unnamed protein product [Amoebophrya sp. A25]|nr:unnamed protein product [Amoebophrya sp. A25]|eukprot:GSA25T00015416001.1